MKKITAIFASLLFLVATSANAITVTGNLKGTLNVVGLTTATIDVAAQTIDFGSPNSFYVVDAQGDLSPLMGGIGIVKDLNTAADYTGFMTVGGFTFDITSATFGSSSGGNYVIGNGIAYYNGQSAITYWKLTNQGGQTSWSATVPEPATLAILGLGLVGFGVARRRKA